jgi:hypothetical protein
MATHRQRLNQMRLILLPSSNPTDSNQSDPHQSDPNQSEPNQPDKDELSSQPDVIEHATCPSLVTSVRKQSFLIA